jgi:hypothetical protein
VASPNRDRPPLLPRLRLLIPPLLPAAVVCVVYLAELAGHTWNVHGDFILVVLIVLGTSAVALIVEIAALVKSFRLIRSGARPAMLDVACIVYGCAFAAGAAGLLVAFVSRQ